MKRTILSLAILSCIGFAQAEYFIQIPVDVKFVKGDSQPNNPETPIDPEVDCETQADQFPEECAPELAGWEKFATDNNLSFTSDWNSLAWASRGLSAIPNDLYPNSNPFNGIALQGNQLTNIGGLQSITSVGTYLYLHGNSLSDISGLSNLQSVGGELYLNNNNITNVNPLNNLNYVGGSIYLYGNPLSDASGLINAEVRSSIRIDKSYNGPKLAFDTRFCSLNGGPRFASGHAQKSQLCEPGNDTWERFAFDRGLTYGTNWNSLAWGSKGITTLPTEAYPNPSITGGITLSSNSIQNVDGLVSIENIGTSSGHLYLNNNQLFNIDGLQNLKTVGGHLMLNSNQLTNLNGLSNLTDVKGVIYAYGNQISDLTGISNAKFSSEISLDKTYNGPKIAADSRFCTLNPAKNFPASYASKYQVCNKGADTWDMFAFDRGFTYGSNWSSVSWYNKSLTQIPIELYPNANPTGKVNLSSNSLTNSEFIK